MEFLYNYSFFGSTNRHGQMRSGHAAPASHRGAALPMMRQRRFQRVYAQPHIYGLSFVGIDWWCFTERVSGDTREAHSFSFGDGLWDSGVIHASASGRG